MSNRLDVLAAATGRIKSFVTEEALLNNLGAQAWQIKEVQDAIVEAEMGDFATDKQVKAVFVKYGAKVTPDQ